MKAKTNVDVRSMEARY